MEFLVRGLSAVGAAAAVSVAAWRLNALTARGAVAGTVVGSMVVGLAGLGPAVVLVLFFVSSSGLSALPGGGARSRRGARQVLANGSVAALAACFHALHAFAGVALLGAVAAATADTWATEVGVRLGRRPRSILTFRRQPSGTSGAVSFPGTLAAAAGALAVAGVGRWIVPGVAGGALVAVTLGGLAGSLADSVTGAGFQAVYRCPACGANPEVARHPGCPKRALRVSGLPGVDNDMVNLIATATGAAISVLALLLL
ncbi:MAG: DUF92 domain-containing protein [Gemmatimonadetes bacterium]|nr:DUF92 domain-containing protein [Gemmatimonadota bacterium]NIO31064.1 DUF92 domain-containing protein [Gemmatimonadota bacterium]